MVPASTRWPMAHAVSDFEMEPALKIVCGVTGMPAALSAKPWPARWTMRPPRTMAIAAPRTPVPSSTRSVAASRRADTESGAGFGDASGDCAAPANAYIRQGTTRSEIMAGRVVHHGARGLHLLAEHVVRIGTGTIPRSADLRNVLDGVSS